MILGGVWPQHLQSTQRPLSSKNSNLMISHQHTRKLIVAWNSEAKLRCPRDGIIHLENLEHLQGMCLTLAPTSFQVIAVGSARNILERSITKQFMEITTCPQENADNRLERPIGDQL
ncbi:hypothetical protein Prudu_1441S000700, partial [Prunus dulcis]